jgi:hypothetical protein
MSYDQPAVHRGLRRLRTTGYAGLAYLGGRPAYLFSSLMRPPRSRGAVGGTRHAS